ncbi:MAG: hypothetical protein ACK4RV_00335 [Caulobacter sp.]
MQDRYAGDIGDYAKLALLRALASDLKVGVAWYRYPDEFHNSDGRHTGYLNAPETWRGLDEPLFDALRAIAAGERSVRALEAAALLPRCRYASTPLELASPSFAERSRWRSRWFEDLLNLMADRELVFADPDNGLCEDHRFSAGTKSAWKRLPLSEALKLSSGRCGVVYHHNTRRVGGHLEEIRYWLSRLGEGAMAVRWKRFSVRTFFIVNATDAIRDRAKLFTHRWSQHADLHENS